VSFDFAWFGGDATPILISRVSKTVGFPCCGTLPASEEASEIRRRPTTTPRRMSHQKVEFPPMPLPSKLRAWSKAVSPILFLIQGWDYAAAGWPGGGPGHRSLPIRSKVATKV
jgi:hypothetical protein